ncbi:hypothetical protein D3M70_10830 [Pseudomonas sp. LS-2]|nr:hypothetical protein D3M70_10830 [Pseudomonas sp. LS-2]
MGMEQTLMGIEQQMVLLVDELKAVFRFSQYGLYKVIEGRRSHLKTLILQIHGHGWRFQWSWGQAVTRLPARWAGCQAFARLPARWKGGQAFARLSAQRAG